MDKKAYYRFAGRDFGVRAALGAFADGLDKTADVDQDAVAAAIDISESVEYMDELQKKAYNAGLLAGYNQVIEALEKGAASDLVVGQLQDVLNTKTASAVFPIAESEDESAEFLSEMVKGAAEGLVSILGGDLDEEAIKTAEAIVVEALGLDEVE